MASASERFSGPVACELRIEEGRITALMAWVQTLNLSQNFLDQVDRSDLTDTDRPGSSDAAVLEQQGRRGMQRSS